MGMGRGGSTGLSSAERAEMWCRWKAGYRMREIARALRCDHGSSASAGGAIGGIGHVTAGQGIALRPAIGATRFVAAKGVYTGSRSESLGERERQKVYIWN